MSLKGFGLVDETGPTQPLLIIIQELIISVPIKLDMVSALPTLKDSSFWGDTISIH